MTANRVCNETLSRAGVGVFTRVASQTLMIGQPVTNPAHLAVKLDKEFRL
jgi:hypothetical protein